MIEKYRNETTGIFVMKMSEYIVGFWPHLQEAVDLMESLSSVEDVRELNTGTAIFMKRALNLEIMN